MKSRYNLVSVLIIGIVFSSGLLTMISRPGPATAGQTAPRKVVAVIPRDFPPTYFRDDKTGTPKGFAIDLMKVVAARAGLEISYVYGNAWTEIEEMLRNGSADLIPNLGIDEERQRNFAFTSPLEVFSVSLFVRAQNSKINGLRDGLNIAVIKGSVAHKLLVSNKTYHLNFYDNFPRALFALLAGEVDAFACPAPTLLRLAHDSGVEDQIKIVGKPITEVKRAIAVRKDNKELLDRLNKAITGLIETAEYRAIYTTWYGDPLPYWTAKKISTSVALLIVLVISLMASWRYLSLRKLNLELLDNIAERQHAEAEVRLANEHLEQRVHERTLQLEQANRDLESFAYSVSHDLRAPLRAINGFSRAVLDDYADTLDDEGKRLLSKVQQNTNRMEQLIADLLSFSRLGLNAMQPQLMDMTQMVRALVEEQQPLVTGRSMEFTVKPLPAAHCDPALMLQVYVNLIGNAVKFTAKTPHATIEIGGSTENGQHHYYVKDNGVGFDMHYADKLFGVFQRLHSVEDFEGTGVGLAIVQRIIRKHGGTVWAESTVNGGATFSFTLPA